ncbi:MAG: FtsX-like permease family protein [Deltaproteobacteria bacterium]|nr:FtsX-like permease family protein [Deltaproteobacteria bacterium]
MALPISYSWRSLIARGTRTTFTVLVIALVVIATTLFWSLIASLKRTLVSSGSPENLVVMRKGATNDGSSQLTLESLQAIRFFEGIARDADGNPLISPELVVQPFFATTDGGRENVLVRGVEPMALRVHDEVVIAEGRMFTPSSGETVVGRGVSRRYKGASLGDELKFGRGTWKVVGILEAGGSSFESEVWVDARELANDAKRTLPYSGVRLRVAPGADMDALVRRIGDDPRYALEATREIDYYESLSSSANTLYVIVIGLAVLAGVGAVFGATNTMYAAVQSRTAEIGTLRALGFSRGSILLAFLSESVMMALFAFALGAIGASLLGRSISWLLGGIAFGAATFTTNVIQLHVAAGDLLMPLALSLLIGVFGGLAPAARAARMRPVDALRKA